MIILLLPSLLTFITLLIHRVRAARAARRDRAPEDFVHSLPWRVWTGNGWEKHAATLPSPEDPSEEPSSGPDRDIERGVVESSTSREVSPEPSWVDQQMECAICLEMFAKGDRVRVLPCNHLFHMNEVDEWLITKKKVVSVSPRLVGESKFTIDHQCPVCKADVTNPRPVIHTPTREPPASPDEQQHPAEPDPPTPNERTPLLPVSSS